MSFQIVKYSKQYWSILFFFFDVRVAMTPISKNPIFNKNIR